MRILCLGSLNLDYSYRVERFVRPGETMEADDLVLRAGGKGLNQSIALAKSGKKVFHAGIVGRESDLLLAELISNGVDTSLIRRKSELETGHAIIQVSKSGENSILIYGGTNRTLTLEYIDEVLHHFEPGDTILLQNEVNLIPEIINEAARRRLRIAFNAAPITSAVLSYPLHLLDWLMVNEVEAAALTGEEDPLAIASVLSRRYPDTTHVLTLGKSGSLVTDGEYYFRSSAYQVETVDTTAAGDTFNGYFLGSVLSGDSILKALTLATAASAICVMRAGAAASIPNLQKVIDFQAEHTNGLETDYSILPSAEATE